MQQQQQNYDEKLNQMEEQMRKVERERGRAFNDLKQIKRVAEETNVMVDQSLASKRSISNPRIIEQQLMGIKDSNKESSNSKQRCLSEKDALLVNMRNEMDSLRSSEDNATALLSDYKRRIQELEAELDKRRESEANLFDTLVMQTKQLEQSKILLEESKLEITSLEQKIKPLQVISATQTPVTDDYGFSTQESVEENMEIEVELEKELFSGEEELTKEEAKTMLEELNMLKNELKSATEAEENSKKAMDDLAFALKEVATEANQVKAKLTLSQVELEHTKGDAERWRTMLRTTEERYKEILETTRKEAERNKNTAERLRLEAEEFLSAWNGKETEFVNCIRRAEEERLLATQESTRVLDLFKEAENQTRVSKEDNQKLRDILKQALNESNVAKEAAEIAKAENARLQDSLNLLFHENEMLKIHEAASFENIRELKRMLSESSMKEFKNEDIMEKPSTKDQGSKDQDNSNNNKESGRKAKAHNNSIDLKDSKSLNKTFSFNLKEMITPHNHKQQQHINKVGGNNEEANNNNKDIDNDNTLSGSIFDEVDSSSDSESRPDVDMGIPDDFDHLDESHFDDPQSDSNSRKRRALLRRFGDLIRRRGYHNHRKEPSNEEHLQTRHIYKKVPSYKDS